MSEILDSTRWDVAYARRFKPYPPFTEDDWRISRNSEASHSLVLKAREATDEAAERHSSRHDIYDHPFCRKCWDRFSEAEEESFRDSDMSLVTSRAQADAKREAVTSEYPDQAVLERIKAVFFDDVYSPKPGDGAKFGLSDTALGAWVEWFHDCENAKEHAAEREKAVLGRALRRLLLFGRLPADEIPAERPDFSHLFLERDALDDLPTPEALIEGVLPRHAYGILRGRDQSYKSFVALDWSLCLATGKPWQGHESEPTKVLYIAGEGAYGLASRVTAWEKAWRHTIPASMFVVRTTALNLHKPGPAFEHLLEHIEDRGYGLVIIDTLRRVSGGADGNGSEMGAVIDNIDRIKQATADGSVLVIAHTQKDDGDTRGYSGIEDDADFVWHAKRSEDFLTLENTKQKDGPEHAPVHLVAQAMYGSLVLAEASPTADVLTGSQEKIVETLTAVFPDGASGTQIMEVADITKPTFYRAIAALLKVAGPTQVLKQGSPQRPIYVMAETLVSHPVSTANTAPDLHQSHKSHGVSSDRPESLTSLTPLKGETETRASQETA